MGRRIISVSRRTDIPAFYSEWFMNRIKEGYCTVVNPFNFDQISRVDLRADAVECLVFWTRNPEPLIPHLRTLDQMGFAYYFLFSVLGYPTEFEPHSPPLDQSINRFKKLSDIIGKEKVVWRYDPVILSSATTTHWHTINFRTLCKELSPYTEKVILSIIDPYKKTLKRMSSNMGEIVPLQKNDYDPLRYREVVHKCAERAKKYNLKISMCAEESDFSDCGVLPGKCIDDELIHRITGTTVTSRKDPSQRPRCQCVRSKDIGAPNTCLYGCAYCYATRSLQTARRAFKEHDPKSPSLRGHFEVVDETIDNEQKELFES